MTKKQNTTVYDYFFNCEEADWKYAQAKLVDSILRLANGSSNTSAGAVSSIDGSGQVLLRVAVGAEGRARSMWVAAKDLLVAPLDLGYVKAVMLDREEPDDWCYMSRYPYRQWKIGLTIRNVVTNRGFAGINFLKTLSNRWGIKEYYLTFEEILHRLRSEEGMNLRRLPWSKDFAVSDYTQDNRPVVLFRERMVGKIEDGGVKFAPQHIYLKEEAERTGAIVNA